MFFLTIQKPWTNENRLFLFHSFENIKQADLLVNGLFCDSQVTRGSHSTGYSKNCTKSITNYYVSAFCVMVSGSCRRTGVHLNTIFMCTLNESIILHDVELKTILFDDFFRPVYMLFISSLLTLMLGHFLINLNIQQIILN